ncbi:MAG: TAXI family TRAP transporter solute-binding subunit [candidate division NC10 bacterium]|nr:TAXI family TRAP transporter solute-binding subunit [candidate division NC10 bacterium]
MARVRSYLLVLPLVVLPLVAAGAEPFRTLTIATGSTGGTYYPIGNAIAAILNAGLEGTTARAIPSRGSIENLLWLERGDVELGITQQDVAYYAFHGQEAFSGRPFGQVRALAALYPEFIQAVVRRDGPVKGIGDLKGRRVALGAQGSGTAFNARQILQTAGVLHEVRAVEAPFEEAITQLEQGNLDAAFLTAGVPTRVIQTLADRVPIRILPIDGPLREQLMRRYPFFSAVTLPSGSYAAPGPVGTVAITALLVCQASIPEETVTQLLRILFANLPYLNRAHPRGADISLEGATRGLAIPLHPGAAQFFAARAR